MISILFWNKNRNPETDSLKKIVQNRIYDLIFIAECENANEIEKLLISINSDYKSIHPPSGNRLKIKMFSSLPDASARIINDDNERLLLSSITTKEISEIIIGSIHFFDRLHHSIEEQHILSLDFSEKIAQIEKLRNNKNTLIIGDFNMNPFDAGMISVKGFNAVHSKNLAMKRNRKYKRVIYDYFYNPMWKYFSENPGFPLGTYFFNSPPLNKIHWNLLDQVILRPSLIKYFEDSKLEDIIIHSIPEFKISNVNLQPNSKFSDHLPVQALLNLEALK